MEQIVAWSCRAWYVKFQRIVLNSIVKNALEDTIILKNGKLDGLIKRCAGKLAEKSKMNPSTLLDQLFS